MSHLPSASPAFEYRLLNAACPSSAYQPLAVGRQPSAIFPRRLDIRAPIGTLRLMVNPEPRPVLAP